MDGKWHEIIEFLTEYGKCYEKCFLNPYKDWFQNNKHKKQRTFGVGPRISKLIDNKTEPNKKMAPINNTTATTIMPTMVLRSVDDSFTEFSDFLLAIFI